MKNKKICLSVVLFLIIVIITFSPIVIPANIDTPWLFGMPRTLWSGILVSFVLAFLTLFTALTLDDDSDKED